MRSLLVSWLAALLVSLAGTAAAQLAPEKSEPHLVFTESSFEAAIARARSRGVVLFVDAWAPWCHTCLFFRERVAPAIDRARVAPWAEFVAVDTEEDEGRAFVAKHPMTEWPTFFVLDPRTEEVRWMSTKLPSASEVEQVVRAEGARYRDELARRRAFTAGVVAQASAKRARGDFLGAAKLIEAQLSLERSSEGRGDLLATLVSLRVAAHDDARCVDALVQFAREIPEGPRVPALALGLSCVQSEAPRRPSEAAEILSWAEASVRARDLLADDRSTLFEAMEGAARALGDDARARTIAAAWLAFVEGEAALASSPGARSVFDAHRVAAALALGEPSRALAAVEQTAREFPSDGHTWLRLAVLLRELGRTEEALARIDVALQHLHGPRRVRAFEVRASVYRREGRRGEAAAALLDAVHEARALVSGARGEAVVQRLTGELARVRFEELTSRGLDAELPAIVQAGDPTLRLRAVEVPSELVGTPEFERLVALMVAVMRKAPGVGLAAPQIGLPWRLFVFEDNEARMAKLSPEERLARGRVEQPLTVIVNPLVAREGGEPAIFFEGCLSVAGYTAAVPRAREVSVTGLDATGRPLALKLRGWPARIVQHEFDHVDGTLYVDRMLARSLSSSENAKRFVQGRETGFVLDAFRARGAEVSGASGAPAPLRAPADRRSVPKP